MKETEQRKTYFYAFFIHISFEIILFGFDDSCCLFFPFVLILMNALHSVNFFFLRYDLDDES